MAGVTCWTRQSAAVLESLEGRGRVVAEERFVREKNQAISDYYLGLYHWLTAGCREFVRMPDDAECPFWLALTDAQRLPSAPACVTLELEVPKECLFVLDYDKWGYRVNDWYVPADRADEAAHNAELARLGIANEAQLVLGDLGNYHPALKGKLVRSWQRLFEGANADMDKNVGVVWEIRREWVRAVEVYE